MQFAADVWYEGAAVMLLAFGTALVAIVSGIIFPIFSSLKKQIVAQKKIYDLKLDAIELKYEKLLKEERANHKEERRKDREMYEERIADIEKDYVEKNMISETRYQVLLEKSDELVDQYREELTECHKEREAGALWKARYEERIRQLERVTIEGKVTAKPDSDGVLRIVTANLGMTKLFGYTRVELIGMPVENLISPRDRDKHLKKVKEHTDQPSGLTSGIRQEVINGGLAIHKDGHLFPVVVELDSLMIEDEPGWRAVITQD